MIVRLVKMTFKSEKKQKFLFFFEENKPEIRRFPSCLMLEILHEKNKPTLIIIYSHSATE